MQGPGTDHARHPRQITRFSRVGLLCYASTEDDVGVQGVCMMSNRRRGYVAYLLRLWQVEEGEDAPWRASLESPQTGERLGFAGLVELFAFLEQVCGYARGQSTPGTGEKGGDAERG